MENGGSAARMNDPTFKLGLVQTPQSFYNPDLFQFNLYAEQEIPNEQDFFSREVNILRNASNAIAYTGSNTVISRQGMVDMEWEILVLFLKSSVDIDQTCSGP